MPLRAIRFHARRPRLGFVINAALAMLFATLGAVDHARLALWGGMVIIFGIASLIFLFIAVRQPRTIVRITDDGIAVEGGLVTSGRIDFAAISTARLGPDPDAENHQQLVIESRCGQILIIDARFLNPDSDEIIPHLREQLASRGIKLEA